MVSTSLTNSGARCKSTGLQFFWEDKGFDGDGDACDRVEDGGLFCNESFIGLQFWWGGVALVGQPCVLQPSVFGNVHRRRFHRGPIPDLIAIPRSRRDICVWGV